jgi:Pectate lyase superfamily protein
MDKRDFLIAAACSALLPDTLIAATTQSKSLADHGGLVGYKHPGIGDIVSPVEEKTLQLISVKDFGAKGDGLTDDTSSINAALASLSSGGALYFPKGTYIVKRGIGDTIPDNIAADNVTIFGDGAASKVYGYNEHGSLPNNGGSQYYNVFQATGKSGITVRDMAFEGYTTPLSLYQCSDITIDNIRDNGLLANASGYMRDKAVYLFKCKDVRVTNSRFINFCFGVYLSGDATQKTSQCIVSNCHFEHTAVTGSYTVLFPVGVYWYYTEAPVVQGCTFKNIYTSVDNGNAGTGQGYAIYEGDGVGDGGIISANTFKFDAKGSKTVTIIYTNEMTACSISGNSFVVGNLAKVLACIRLDAKRCATDYAVCGNTFQAPEQGGPYHVWVSDQGTYGTRLAVCGNVFTGGNSGIRIDDGSGLGKHNISGNTFIGQRSAILANGAQSQPIKHMLISNNYITKSHGISVVLNSYCVSTVLIGNTIFDGNLDAAAGDAGAAVLFTSYSFGCYVANNVIGNTVHGEGKFTYTISNASNASDQIFKNILRNNIYMGGIAENANRFYNGNSPTCGLFDLQKHEYFENGWFNGGGIPGWYCSFIAKPTLTADASNGSTTVAVSSTSGFVAGDVILLCKDANPYEGDYCNSNNWHKDTIASIADSTHFVLATGIPARDGAYVAGIAIVSVARFRAAAAIAA